MVVPKSQAAAPMQWQKVKPQSVSSQIVAQIRGALFRGDLKPGDLLGSETDFAHQFGVSRVPVRDAFKTLQALGIIEIKMGANGGARIAAGDPHRFADALAIQLKLVGIGIEEMFDAQIAIEVMAAELGTTRATAEDIAALRAILAELKAMAAKPLTASVALRFTEGGLRFHAALVGTAHNRALSAQFEALRVVLEPTYAQRTSDSVAKRVAAEDEKILDALEARDAERTRMLVRRRLETIRAHHLLQTVKK